MKQIMPKRVLLFCFSIFMIALMFCPFWGPIKLHWTDVFCTHPVMPENRDSVIFFSIRLPRVLSALIAGAALACAGAVFQTVLRNPLACPFTLGVAGGASLGAALALFLSFPSVLLGIPSVTLSAFLGAALSLVLVLSISSAFQPLNRTTLILAGVATNFLLTSIILFFFYAANYSQNINMLHWLLGGLDTADPSTIRVLFFSLIPPVALLAYLSRDLDVLAAGDEFARTKGVSVERTTLISLVAASLLTGAVVAQTGPIGFVGLLVPHLLRPFTGVRHRILLPASALFGGAFLAICDAAARTFFAPAEMPVGIITSLSGGPFFLFLLLRTKKIPSID